MCGLFGGMANTLTTHEVENIRTLGLVSMLRGTDSTGILTASMKNRYYGKVEQVISKDVFNSGAYLYSYHVSKMLDKSNLFLIAGHCRDATIGAINKDNAHPFQHKHIRGMHNGTVHSFAPPKEMEDEYTDSRCLIESIADVGLVETLKHAKDGAYALVYTDSREGTLNLIRNDKRTLYYVQSTAQCVYWASERTMLQFMMDRSSHTFKEIKFVPSNELHTFPFGKIDPIVTDLKAPSKPTVFLPKPQASVSVPEVPGKHTKMKWNPKTLQLEPVEEYSLWEDAQFEAAFSDVRVLAYEGYDGKKMTKEDAEHLLEQGCVGCGEIADMDDRVGWFNEKEFLCGTCMQSDWHKEYTSHYPKHIGRRIKQ